MLYDVRKDFRRQGHQLQGIGRTSSWPQSQIDSLLFASHREIFVQMIIGPGSAMRKRAMEADKRGGEIL